jgi:plastocyanin
MSLKRWAICLAVVALLGAACGGDSGDDGGAGGGGAAATLTASNFAFDPTSLTAAAGGSIDFTNEDDAEHNFTIEDLDIDEDAEGGDSITVDLGDAEAGTYDFFCKYHKDSMTGTLEITS